MYGNPWIELVETKGAVQAAMFDLDRALPSLRAGLRAGGRYTLGLPHRCLREN